MLSLIVVFILSFLHTLRGHYLVQDLEPVQTLCRFDCEQKLVQRMVQVEAEVEKLKKRLNPGDTETDSGCPDGWMKFDSSCYHFGVSDLAFQDAEIFCVGLDAHLANIESASEFATIQAVLKRLKAPNHWIGMVDEQTEGVWKHYPSGKTATYIPWSPGQPEQGRSANCVAIWESHVYLYVDEPCSNKFKPICEKPYDI